MTPGGGAAHIVRLSTRYVYVVRSVRTGQPSIGIDLTPNGACPLACDYCQVPRRSRTAQPPVVELLALEAELRSALQRFGPTVGDVVFAGSGEPTWSPQFGSALAVARTLVEAEPRRLPVRVFTAGVTLDRENIAHDLSHLVRSGSGEVWVKMDAWDEASYQRTAGVRGYTHQERRIICFARETPVILQVMLTNRRGGPTNEQLAAGLAGGVGRLASEGARIRRVVLSTLFRPPGDGNADPRPLDESEIAQVARAIAAIGVELAVPRVSR